MFAVFVTVFQWVHSLTPVRCLWHFVIFNEFWTKSLIFFYIIFLYAKTFLQTSFLHRLVNSYWNHEAKVQIRISWSSSDTANTWTRMENVQVIKTIQMKMLIWIIYGITTFYYLSKEGGEYIRWKLMTKVAKKMILISLLHHRTSNFNWILLLFSITFKDLKKSMLQMLMLSVGFVKNVLSENILSKSWLNSLLEGVFLKKLEDISLIYIVW